MTQRQPPRLGVWMLKHFGSGPDNDALLGDLAETLGACIVGILSGWIVGRLHRRKVSMVLAHGTTVLVNWIVLDLTTRPEVWPPLIWFVPVLTLGIVLGGVLCASRRDITFQQGGSL